MRLNAAERAAVEKAFRSRFPDARRLILFGSRAEDAKRGGDIDLLVVGVPDDAAALDASLWAMTDVQIHLGMEIKIDVVVAPDETDSRLVVREALRKGVDLWKT